MVLIVASLFLPFQPQFEINASETEAAALVESQPIKIPTAPTGVASESGSNLGRKRTSSVHSNSPFASLDNNIGSELADGPSNRRGSDATKADSPGISSEMFMENLTANATNTSVAATPANPIQNRGNTSIEEFFSSGNHGLLSNGTDLNSGVSSRNFSVTSTPGHEAAHNSGHDSTANLLKSVNRSLYQSVLNNSNSTTALEGKTPSHSNGTVITPRSRNLPDLNSSVVELPKAKQQQQQFSLPAMKMVHRKSSGATPPILGDLRDSTAPLTASNLKHAVHAYDPSFRSPTPSGLRNNVIEESDSDNLTSDNEDEAESNKRHSMRVPQFGGYSNNAKLRASLLRGSCNIFETVPWKIVPSGKGNGGLKNAISTAVLEKTIDEPVTWVGTVGIPTDSIPKDVLSNIVGELESTYHSAAVISDDITFKGAYKNFCKQILWPTLHYQIPDNPNSKAFEDHSWNYYQHLNQLFADKIVATYQEGDIIWVHDYHLMLVPGMVRQKLPHAKIGFFLHVSFPSSEVFRCFAQRENILNGILGANSVGFQTQEYARHFLQTSNRLLMTDVDSKALKYKGRIIAVSSTPIGIDAFNLEAQLQNDQVSNWRQLIRGRWAGKKLIVCRDQFDRIRGLRKKLVAYERFLRANPKYISNVVMIQICLGSDRDPELEREIMVVVDRINSLSSDISISQPVVFLHQDLDFAQYLALNCEADLFLVNTMREGMNLTCHEFVVCSREKNAPLLLSEFTGSAHVLKCGAFLINPWDIKHVAQTIKIALELPKEEKRRRWKKMFKSIMNNDSDNWIESSLSSIQNSWEFNHERSTVFNLSYEQLYSSFVASKKRVFILKISEPPTSRTLSILTELTTNNIVYIINSFSRNMLERLYSRTPHVGLIAENGAYVRLNGHWFNIVEDVSWKNDIIKVIEDKVERLPGSYYKTGESMIRFHTENAEDQDRVSSVVGEAITHVNTLFGDRGIHAYLHKNIVFVQQIGLAMKALQFLLSYFNSVGSTTNSTPQRSQENSPMLSPIVTPSLASGLTTPGTTSANNSYFSLGRNITHIDFLAITGSSSPVVEPLFEYVNELVKSGSLSFGYSVVYGSTTSTYAKEHIEGLNELFSMLDKLAQVH
ncbi:LAFE_0E05622g1_1 [Lachancea fermentati]|uniref:LAFE_0E05622g1_1 n=1 Tax=Lachancea fermentati TaxID=4955 RepID=A0A1G4MCS5_LACFM|nr:LAFE_0E05622g1_1 [Lachancea fermentati]